MRRCAPPPTRRKQLTEVDAADLLVSIACHISGVTSVTTSMTEHDEGILSMDEREWPAQHFEAHRTHHRSREGLKGPRPSSQRATGQTPGCRAWDRQPQDPT